jgi:AcrR family transcriptional regulator
VLLSTMSITGAPVVASPGNRPGQAASPSSNTRVLEGPYNDVVGRPPRFDSQQILDATALLIAEGGPGQATVASIAKRLGAPSGSIYHRFESRDLLLARLWIRTVHRAQQGFLAALAIDDVGEAAREAALHLPRWSRQNRAEASVLLLYRREDLADRWPEELGQELAELNDDLQKAIRRFTRRRFGRVTPSHLQTVAFALIDVPYASCRRYLLAGDAPPAMLDELVVRTCDCTLFEHR